MAAYRDFKSLVHEWHFQKLLSCKEENDLRLQIDGTAMRTDMGDGSNNLFIALAKHKLEVGLKGEYHLATYFGKESATNFRKYFSHTVDQVVTAVRDGMEVDGCKYTFRLLVCCDYPALTKLMGCGYHTGNYRCAICYYDIRQPGNLFRHLICVTIIVCR